LVDNVILFAEFKNVWFIRIDPITEFPDFEHFFGLPICEISVNIGKNHFIGLLFRGLLKPIPVMDFANHVVPIFDGNGR
jgi:hypothetical protein